MKGMIDKKSEWLHSKKGATWTDTFPSVPNREEAQFLKNFVLFKVENIYPFLYWRGNNNISELKAETNVYILGNA